MRETDDIERLFQESFEAFEVTPPTSVKTAIDKELKSRKRLVWWLSALVIMLATIASSLVYFNQNSSTPNSAKATFLAKNTISQRETSFSSSNKNGSTVHSSKNSLKNTQKLKQSPVITDQSKESIAAKNGRPPMANSSSVSPFKTNSSLKKTKKQTNKSLAKNGNSPGKKESGNRIINELTPPSAKGNETQVSGEIVSNGSQNINETKSDSTVSETIDSAAVNDSTSLATNLPQDSTQTANQDDKPKSGDKKWFASYYLGPQFDLWNISKPDFSLNMNPSIRTSIEISRKLKSNFSISAGLGYNKLRETSSVTYISSIDSTFAGIDSIPIYDPQVPDSIIGYNIYTVYQSNVVKSQATYTNTTTVFYVPLFIGKTFELSDKWFVMTDLGATFNFYNTKRSASDPNSPVKSYNSFGINAALRLYGGYKFNENWMVTAGFTYSIYLKTPVVYNGSSGQRMFLSPQLGIHYSF